MALTLLYSWLVLIVVIVFRFDMSVLLLLMLFVVGNRIAGFISIELIFIVVLACIWLSSSTYERRGAVSYLWFFSLLIGFGMVVMFDIHVISLVVLIVVLAKLPIVGMHI